MNRKDVVSFGQLPVADRDKVRRVGPRKRIDQFVLVNVDELQAAVFHFSTHPHALTSFSMTCSYVSRSVTVPLVVMTCVTNDFSPFGSVYSSCDTRRTSCAKNASQPP